MSKARRTRDVNPALKIRDFYSFGMQILNQINYALYNQMNLMENWRKSTTQFPMTIVYK